jgi:hypothetical protein
MEDDLNFSRNGRLPQFSGNGRPSQLQDMEDNLKFSENGRQPKFFRKWKTT